MKYAQNNKIKLSFIIQFHSKVVTILQGVLLQWAKVEISLLLQGNHREQDFYSKASVQIGASK